MDNRAAKRGKLQQKFFKYKHLERLAAIHRLAMAAPKWDGNEGFSGQGRSSRGAEDPGAIGTSSASSGEIRRAHLPMLILIRTT